MQAYKLFSEGKTTVEVAIILNLREPKATKFYIVLEAKITI
jgi:DNA-binding CsgD family transcriptional regulator